MKKYIKYLPSAIVFITGIVVSIILINNELKKEEVERNDYIEKHILERKYAFENELKSSLDILSLFQHDWDIPYEEFKLHALPILKSHKSISSLYWVEEIVDNKRNKVETELKEKLFEPFTLTEFNELGEYVVSGYQDNYFPILYKASSTKNTFIEGFDLGSIETVKKEFQNDYKTGKIAITDCINLCKDNSQNIFLVIFPIFEENCDSSVISRDNIQSFIVAEFEYDKIIENSIEKFIKENIWLNIYDITDSSKAKKIFSFTNELGKTEIKYENYLNKTQSFSYNIKVANRIWELEFYTNESLKRNIRAISILIIGLIFTIIVTLYLFNIVVKSNKVRKLSKELMFEIEGKNKIEKVLRESEEKYKATFLTSPDSINIHTMDGVYVDINEGFTKVSGYTRDDVIGKSSLEEDIWTKPKDREYLISELKSKGECNNLESVFRCKNGEIITGLVSAKIIHLDGVEHLLSITRDITKQKEREKLILKTIIDTEERERKRFAEDLHDELGPFLSGIKLYIKELGYQDVSYEQRLSIIEYLNEFIDSAVEKTRSISSQLMPNVLTDYGLVKALNSFCVRISNTKEINIEFESNIIEKIDNSTVEVILYRIAIELINNTIKHAEANLIYISLNKFNELLQLTYTDNGKGFDIEKELAKEKGLGLSNIVNRLNSIKGTYKSIKKSKGTHFNIIIDLSLT